MAVQLRHERLVGLVEAAARSDQRAVRQLVDACSVDITRYCERRGSADSEALANLVFAEFFAALPRLSFTADQQVWAFLYRIARNRLIDEFRKQPRVPRPEMLAGGQSFCHPDPADMVVDRDWLRGLVTNLSEDQQRVIELRFGEELSLAETARRTGKSVGAVKALQHRAVAALAALVALTSVLVVIAMNREPSPDRIISVPADVQTDRSEEGQDRGSEDGGLPVDGGIPIPTTGAAIDARRSVAAEAVTAEDSATDPQESDVAEPAAETDTELQAESPLTPATTEAPPGEASNRPENLPATTAPTVAPEASDGGAPGQPGEPGPPGSSEVPTETTVTFESADSDPPTETTAVSSGVAASNDTFVLLSETEYLSGTLDVLANDVVNGQPTVTIITYRGPESVSMSLKLRPDGAVQIALRVLDGSDRGVVSFDYQVCVGGSSICAQATATVNYAAHDIAE